MPLSGPSVSSFYELRKKKSATCGALAKKAIDDLGAPTL
jgi:hypothetical protein